VKLSKRDAESFAKVAIKGYDEGLEFVEEVEGTEEATEAKGKGKKK
jgi:hypothetical protein